MRNLNEGVVMGLGLWAMAEGLQRSPLDPETVRVAGIGIFFVVVLFVIRGWMFANRIAKQTPVRG